MVVIDGRRIVAGSKQVEGGQVRHLPAGVTPSGGQVTHAMAFLPGGTPGVGGGGSPAVQEVVPGAAPLELAGARRDGSAAALPAAAPVAAAPVAGGGPAAGAPPVQVVAPQMLPMPAFGGQGNPALDMRDRWRAFNEDRRDAQRQGIRSPLRPAAQVVGAAVETAVLSGVGLAERGMAQRGRFTSRDEAMEFAKLHDPDGSLGLAPEYADGAFVVKPQEVDFSAGFSTKGELMEAWRQRAGEDGLAGTMEPHMDPHDGLWRLREVEQGNPLEEGFDNLGDLESYVMGRNGGEMPEGYEGYMDPRDGMFRLREARRDPDADNPWRSGFADRGAGEAALAERLGPEWAATHAVELDERSGTWRPRELAPAERARERFLQGGAATLAEFEAGVQMYVPEGMRELVEPRLDPVSMTYRIALPQTAQPDAAVRRWHVEQLDKQAAPLRRQLAGVVGDDEHALAMRMQLQQQLKAINTERERQLAALGLLGRGGDASAGGGDVVENDKAELRALLGV